MRSGPIVIDEKEPWQRPVRQIVAGRARRAAMLAWFAACRTAKKGVGRRSSDRTSRGDYAAQPRTSSFPRTRESRGACGDRLEPGLHSANFVSRVRGNGEVEPFPPCLNEMVADQALADDGFFVTGCVGGISRCGGRSHRQLRGRRCAWLARWSDRSSSNRPSGQWRRPPRAFAARARASVARRAGRR